VLSGKWSRKNFRGLQYEMKYCVSNVEAMEQALLIFLTF